MSLWMKSLSVTTQMKATELYFRMVLFIMLHKVVATYKSGGMIRLMKPPLTVFSHNFMYLL